MGALQKLMAQIIARLRGVTASQRIALLLGGALVAISLIWLAQWAASPEMVPLLEQDLQPEELALARSGLEAINEPFDVQGNRVFVRSSANRSAIIAQLQQQEKLPANTSVGFAALVKESNPWISSEERNRRWTYALQKELEQVLRRLQGVKSGRVFLNLGTQRRSFSRNHAPTSASVTLIMKHDEQVGRPLALAAARLVSGAVAGLAPRNVQVVDANGRIALDWDGEESVSNQLDRKLLQEERRFADKIRRQIPDPNALVSVQVELDATARNTHTETPIEGQPISERTMRDSTIRVRRSENPGVQPNVGIAAGSGPADENHEQETSETELKTGLSTSEEATPAGEVKKVTAAISLSYTYLEGVYRSANASADAEPPTDSQIEDVFQRERERLAKQIAQLVKPQAEENVAISRYYDAAVEPVTASSPSTLDGTLDLMRDYGPQSALGLLALVSLGLMLRMARKTDAGTGDSFGLELGLPQEAIDAAKVAASDMSAAAEQVRAKSAARRTSRGGAGSAAGPAVATAEMSSSVEQAAASEGMLVAQEVDANTVQTRKMLEQVTQMVDSDGDLVSNLIDQWMQRNEQYHDE